MTQPTAKLNAFPVFLRVEGRVVVIVGGGEEALAKARLLGQSSATIKSWRRARPELAAWIAENGAIHVAAEYHPDLLAGAVMVFAATGDDALDRRVSDDARAARHSGQRRRPAGALRFLHAGDRQSRAGLRGDRHGRRRTGAGAVDPRRIDQLLSPSLGTLAALAASLREAAERLLPKGRLRRQFWNDFFAGAPARAMEVGHADEALQAASELMRRRSCATATSRWSAPAQAPKTC